MYNLETAIMTSEMTVEFLKWFNKNIGTDYEQNSDPSGEDDGQYVVVFELIVSEFVNVKSWLKERNIESYRI